MMFAVPSEPYEVSPHDRARAQAAADPARRPRAELLDVDGAPGRIERRQPLRVDRGRASTRSGVRCTAARTRPCIEMLAEHPRRRRRHRQVRAAGQGPERRRSGSRASATASTRTTTRGPGSSRRTADRVLAELGRRDELLDIALQLEEVALTDEYFIERKLYPNVDFYSGLIYRAMGFPTEHVHRAVRDGPAPRLDRALEGDDGEPEDEDRPAPPDLHRPAPSASTSPSTSAADPLARPQRTRAAVDLTPTAAEARAARRGAARGCARNLPWEYGKGLPPRFDDLADEVAFGREWQAKLAERPLGRRRLARGVRRPRRRRRSSTTSSPRSWPGPAPRSSSAASASTSSARRCSRTAPTSRRRAGCPRILDAPRSGASSSASPAPAATSPSLTHARPTHGRRRLGRSTARRSGRATRSSPTGAGAWPAPTPTSPQAAGHLRARRRHARRRASRCGRCARSPTSPSSTRCSSPTCSSPTTSSSARCDEGWRIANSTLTHERGINPRQLVIHIAARRRAAAARRSSAARSTTTASRQRLAAGVRRGAAVPAAQLALALAHREGRRRPGPRAASTSCSGAR